MLGYIRFFLAMAVLVSHANVRVGGLNPGVIAVVIFYMLAGGVVTHLWQHVIPVGEGKLWRFYRDRLQRIAPLYLYAALLTLAFLLLTDYGAPHYSPATLLYNLLVIPLNYYMYIDATVMSAPAWCLIPQAWSLGAELQAYLLLPFALLYPWARRILFALSFAIYLAANLTYLNADYFGYRLVPGVFFIFLMGSYIKESQNDLKGLLIPVFLFSVMAVVYLVFEFMALFPAAYMKETLIGMLIGVPLITYAYQSSKKLPYNKLLGSLSYGVFLTHFLVIWLLDYSAVAIVGSAQYWVLLVGLTVIISLVGVLFVEKHYSQYK